MFVCLFPPPDWAGKDYIFSYIPGTRQRDQLTVVWKEIMGACLPEIVCLIVQFYMALLFLSLR